MGNLGFLPVEHFVGLCVQLNAISGSETTISIYNNSEPSTYQNQMNKILILQIKKK